MIAFALAVVLLVGFAAGIVWEGARRGGTVDWETRCWTAQDRAADLHDEAEASPLRSLQFLGQLVREALAGQVAPGVVPEQVSRG